MSSHRSASDAIQLTAHPIPASSECLSETVWEVAALQGSACSCRMRPAWLRRAGACLRGCSNCHTGICSSLEMACGEEWCEIPMAGWPARMIRCKFQRQASAAMEQMARHCAHPGSNMARCPSSHLCCGLRGQARNTPNPSWTASGHYHAHPKADARRSEAAWLMHRREATNVCRRSSAALNPGKP